MTQDATKPRQYDLVVVGRTGVPALAVEIKALRQTSAGWAALTRRNLAVHDFLLPAAYFLFVAGDQMYLWEGPSALSPEPVPPDAVADSLTILSPYYERSHLDPATTRGSAFELVVFAWIADLTDGLGGPVPGDPAWQRMLDAIRAGRATFEYAP